MATAPRWALVTYVSDGVATIVTVDESSVPLARKSGWRLLACDSAIVSTEMPVNWPAQRNPNRLGDAGND